VSTAQHSLSYLVAGGIAAFSASKWCVLLRIPLQHRGFGSKVLSAHPC